jgi:acyl-CoA reductase-like NAD-dependent aldehyde dehydrogenase
VLCGGQRDGTFYQPTLLSGVPARTRLMCEEIFGPVAVIAEYDELSEALAMVNDSSLGIHAGVFTRDLFKARQAFEALEVGGVMINDVPTMRIDAMPYGGVKQSGLGREGVRFAIDHFTELKTMIVRYM